MRGIKEIMNGKYELPYFNYSPHTWGEMGNKYKNILIQ